MKRILFLSFFSLLAINVFSTTFTIVGKGSSGESKCSGYIRQYGNKITIHLTDMLEEEYTIISKDQIDENTIIYTVNIYSRAYIKKWKSSYDSDVYYFEFPPLYPQQGRTTYKAVKLVIDGIEVF